MTTEPTLYPVENVFHLVGKEATEGTAVAGTMTVGLAKPLEWNDKPTWLDDKSLRGSMVAGPSDVEQGVTIGELTVPESILYVDSFGWALASILGDLTTVGDAAPYANAWSVLNTATGQPGTQTWTEYYGPTPTSGARQFAATCFSEVTISWDIQKGYLSWSGKAASWMSTPAAAKPVDAQSSVRGIPAWQFLMGIGGPASGGTQVLECQSGKITIKRKVTPQWGSGGTQNPYAMFRGGVTASFSDLVFLAKDESIYGYMMNNSKPQTQFVFNNELTGVNQGILQIDGQATSFKVSKPDTGQGVVKWSCSGDFVNNTTNAGATGGLSPLKVTLTNAIATGTYQ